jgi:hypothetical protein
MKFKLSGFCRRAFLFGKENQQISSVSTGDQNAKLAVAERSQIARKP